MGRQDRLPPLVDVLESVLGELSLEQPSRDGAVRQVRYLGGGALLLLASAEELETSGIDNNSVSVISPKRLLSSKEIPGFETTDKVNEPSLNSGRKLRPNDEKIIREITNKPNVEKIISFLCFKAHVSDRS